MAEKRHLVSFYFLTFVLFCNPVHGISGAFYADNGREQSILYKTLAKKDKILLQKEILNLLGLESRPKKGQFYEHRKHDLKVHKSSAELFLLNLYKVMGDGDDGSICDRSETCMRPLKGSDFIISFENKVHNHEFPYLKRACDRRFYFNVKQMPPAEGIIKAELRMFRNITKRSERSRRYNYNLILYAVSEKGNDSSALELVDELVVTGADNGKWLVMNVTIPLMKWIAFPENNYGLYLKIKSITEYKGRARAIQPSEIGLLTSRAPAEYKAFMVAYMKTPSHVRVRTKRVIQKRSTTFDYDRYNPYNSPQGRYITKSRTCERWTLYVSFNDLGFEDWIIAPDGYAAFYCDGFCTFPLNAHMNATNHAIVQTLMHLMDPTSVPRPSCAPTELTPLTVLYFDDNSNVILKRYKNMVVKTCGCQ